MRVAILGDTGQLARCLAENAPRGASHVRFGRDQLDLADPGAPLAAALGDGFDLIINAAAYTAVDKAEEEREAAFALNARGPARLAEFCATRGLPLIHVSTDYVFDGTASRPYREDDLPAPLNTYGESKLAGERAVAGPLSQHVILRTSWLYSIYGKNFVTTMLRLGRERDELRIVADQIGRPTSAHQLARVIWNIAEAFRQQPNAFAWGIYHYADSGEASWADFADEIFSASSDLLSEPPRVWRITTEAFPTPAPRPRYSVLDTDRIERVFQIAPRPWKHSLGEVLRKLEETVA
ncbi:MAG: dTDP-4-dehydrorhamnose reductase [Dichotomicrobium sp.]